MPVSTLVAAALMSQTGQDDRLMNPDRPFINTGIFFRVPVTRQGDLFGPDDISVVFFYTDEKKQEFEPLEMCRGFLRRVTTGVFSNRNGIQVPGQASPIRFKQGKIPKFVVTILPGQQLPTKWECFRFDVRGERFLQFQNDGLVADTGPRGVHVRASHHVGDVFKLKVENLPPGEYGFKYGLSNLDKDLYCFGVDPQ